MNECAIDKVDVVDQATDSFVEKLRAGWRPIGRSTKRVNLRAPQGRGDH